MGHCAEGNGGSDDYPAAVGERNGGIFSKFDEFSRHEAHQRAHSSGFGEREGGGGGGCVGAHFPEPRDGHGYDRIRDHDLGGCSLQRS